MSTLISSLAVLNFIFYLVAAIDDSHDCLAGPNPYANLHIIRKPGDVRCKIAYPDDWPNTFQCAETDLCLPMTALRNGTYDCCGPLNTKNCSDKSDENRLLTPGACPTTPSNSSMVFQCAKTKKCLSRGANWLNGRCDCCDNNPTGDCCKCDDHSDEECLEWDSKYYCCGRCMWYDKTKPIPECPADCIGSDGQSGIGREKPDGGQDMQKICGTFVQKRTPHCNCTNGYCLPCEAFMNGVKDCPGGDDEDAKKNLPCSTDEVKKYCKPDDEGKKTVKQCYKLNGGKTIDCRYGKPYNDDITQL